jgi:hypothetical protein
MQNQSLVHDLSINNRNKLVWTGSFEALQQFVQEVLELNAGKWSSPGADAKLFEAEEKDIAIKWYAKSQTITVNGINGAEIEGKLKSVASMTKSLADAKRFGSETDVRSLETTLEILNGKLQTLRDELSSKGLFIWAKVIPVSEKTFRQVYERDLALLRK